MGDPRREERKGQLMTRRAVDTLMMMKVKRSEGEDWWEGEEKDGRQKVRAIGDPRKRKTKGNW